MRWVRIGCFVVVVGIAALFGVFAIFYWMETSDPIPYINRITGLRISDAVEDVHQYDNAQFQMVAHVRLTPSEVERLLREHDFKRPPSHTACLQGPSDLPLVDGLPEEFQTAPAGAEVLEWAGCEPENHWQAFLVPSSRQFWISIAYPDWGGDPPGCRRNLIECGPFSER